MKSIQTLLIANRGEIAVRIIRTCQSMGIRTVAVFAEADRDALHVELADTAYCLGEGPVNVTYLDRTKMIDAMKATAAEAVHPGYGFLSEDTAFAEAVLEHGFIWVGPPVSAMASMASKALSKQTLEPKGVPMIPGYHGDDQSDPVLTQQAQQIGFPVLVKASAGGGGKGMKIVEQPGMLADAIASARREAANSFGDDRLLLEKFLIQPRHIEVQIMADQHGNVVSLFERDCSVQRRHQKVLEEAPAPNLPIETKKAMWHAAETTAREIGYQGAGTVEFILSADGEFYFLEMNTRLQVEHPVTEFITDLDLVEWQIRVAQGEALVLEKPDQPHGHSIEVRLYAEDPAQNFLPMVGRLESLSFPAGEGVRIDSGVRSPTNVSSFYDPMLAKIIVHDKTREAALTKLRRVLNTTRAFGITTNLAFLRQLVQTDEVAKMDIHTRWLDEHPQLFQPAGLISSPCWAALACVLQQQNRENDNPWHRHLGWRMDGQSNWRFALDETTTVFVQQRQQHYQVGLGEQMITASHVRWVETGKNSGRLIAEVDGISVEWDVYFYGETIWLDNGQRKETVSWWQASKAHDHDLDSNGKMHAVLPGVVTATYKTEGSPVNVGDKLISYEAMKMETTLVAEVSGELAQFTWSVGDQISEGDLLYEVEVEEEAS